MSNSNKNKLIINTANSSLLIVLYLNGKVITKNENSVKRHNERILELIDEVLNENAITLFDIDEFGVVVGPGSFTGIRVGIATMKAFRDVTNKKAKGINNLTILNELAKEQNISIVAIEGSLNSYFVGENINGKFYINTRNLTEEELSSLAKNAKVGCYEITDNMRKTNINFVDLAINNDAILKAHEMAKDETLTPVYYQLSQAENDKISKLNLEFKDMNIADIEQIEAIEIANFDSIDVGDKPWNKGMLTDLLKNKNMINIVAKSNDKVLGYIVGEVSDEINISRVAVLKDYQNHGIASALIDYLSKIAKAKDMNLSLEVCENNITAYKLYVKLGFVLRRERKNYYKDGSTCLEMIKTFNN